MCPERPEERSTLPAIDQRWDALTEEHLPIDPISTDEEDWDKTQSSGFKHTHSLMQSRPCDSITSTGKVSSGDKWCKCFIKLLHPTPTPQRESQWEKDHVLRLHFIAKWISVFCLWMQSNRCTRNRSERTRCTDLHPCVRITQLYDQLRPPVNHSADLCRRHEREGDVRPGVEAHDLTDKHTGKQHIWLKLPLKTL